MMPRASQPAVLILSSVLVAGVAWSAPAKTTPAKTIEAADPPVPKLRTGTAGVTEHAQPITATVARRNVDAREELTLLELTIPDDSESWACQTTVTIDHAAGAPAPFAFSQREPSRGESLRRTIWVRRLADQAKQPIVGQLFDCKHGNAPADRYHFAAPGGGDKPSDKSDRARFYAAASQWFKEHREGGAFYAFAAARLAQVGGDASAKAARTQPRRLDADELSRLMDTTTGAISIQEALQEDRPLWIAAQADKATVPMSALAGPPLADHPFVPMLAALKPRAEPHAEALASAAPADFYYLRVASTDVLFRILDQADAWGTPLTNVLSRQAEDRELSARYLAQLGLGRGPLTRALGTQVIGELAMVGSDPYVREGSDVTVLFAVKQRALFDAALGSTLAEQAGKHGGVVASSVAFEGATIAISSSADGGVRQHRAHVGDVEIVSNSLEAVKRVLRAASGTAPRLSAEPDFRFMLARDAGVRADGYAFLGDRFVQAVVGPRQKILESRRLLALAELLEPGWSALLGGWLDGTSARDVAALSAAGWLRTGALRHLDGAAIEFTPGTAARSRWGTPAMMTPLIDLPTPTAVTPTERDAYARFVTGYQQHWRQYIDPIALRIAVVPAAGGSELAFDLRVLPLIDGTDYRELATAVGRAHVSVPALAAGLRATLGIGREAKLRRELSQSVRSNPFGGAFQIDWLGDWVLFGVEDRSQTARFAYSGLSRELPQAPAGERSSDDQLLAEAIELPVYLGLGIAAPAGAVVFLSAARKMVLDSAPGIVDWGEHTTKKGHKVVRIGVKAGAVSSKVPGIQLFYALTGTGFFASMRESTLDAILDTQGKANGSFAVSDQAAPQFILDAASDRGPLLTTLGWLLEAAASAGAGTSRARAEAFLRGAPGASDPRALAIAYEGSTPLTPDGKAYELAPEGVRDPKRGSAYQPIWPPQPVAGSPVDRLLSVLRRFRSEVAFDEESAGLAGKPAKPTADDDNGNAGPTPMRSLHVRLSIGLRNTP